jgi:hypothetical protein
VKGGWSGLSKKRGARVQNRLTKKNPSPPGKLSKRKRQEFTSDPLKDQNTGLVLGKKVTARHGMGGMFARSSKKPESDMPPRTRRAERSALRSRLQSKFI